MDLAIVVGDVCVSIALEREDFRSLVSISEVKSWIKSKT